MARGEAWRRRARAGAANAMGIKGIGIDVGFAADAFVFIGAQRRQRPAVSRTSRRRE